MGLDMYLLAKEHLSEYDKKVKSLFSYIKTHNPFGFDEHLPAGITFELAYWRKANAIHGWFVENVQAGVDDCKEYYVSLKKLKELKETCEKVVNDPDLANELLPTRRGFFYGDYEYDEWYIEDLKKTISMLDNIINNPNSEKWWMYYHASW